MFSNYVLDTRKKFEKTLIFLYTSQYKNFYPTLENTYKIEMAMHVKI